MDEPILLFDISNQTLPEAEVALIIVVVIWSENLGS